MIQNIFAKNTWRKRNAKEFFLQNMEWPFQSIDLNPIDLSSWKEFDTELYIKI